jgi:hypothetical protein
VSPLGDGSSQPSSFEEGGTSFASDGRSVLKNNLLWGFVKFDKKDRHKGF